MRNVLYRALGQNDDVDVDIYETHLRSGDRIVLCSDGLTRHVKPNEIASLVIGVQDLDGASQSLIDLANSRGGEDNVSVIIIALDGVDTDVDTDELERILSRDTDKLVSKETSTTIELNVLNNNEPQIGDNNLMPSSATPDSDGHDALAPEQ
jgi:serine/threonine protein phosphatase PrpC